MSSLRTGRNKWKTNQIHSPENIEMISSNENKDCETNKDKEDTGKMTYDRSIWMLGIGYAVPSHLFYMKFRKALFFAYC